MLEKKVQKFMGVYLDEEMVTDFHMIALKEKKKLKELHLEIIEDYLKKHGDGNPQFTIDQFDDPNFIACPAFYRDGNTWESYIKQATDDELQKLKHQVILIDRKLGRYI